MLCRYLAVGAAFLLVTSAAIGPFTQQSIKSYACQRPLQNVTASIPTASWIDSRLIVGISSPGYRASNLKMMTAALEAIVGSSNDSMQVPFDCPTGNCDFEPYSSLAYCSSCADITSHVQEKFDWYNKTGYWNYSLPTTFRTQGMLQSDDEDYCQLRFLDDRGHPNFWGEQPSFPYTMSDELLTHLVICRGERVDSYNRSATNFNVLSVSWANCSDDGYDGCGSYPQQLPSLADTSGLIAMDCTFGLCLKDYTARVRNGVLEERTTGGLLAEPMGDANFEFRMVKLPCVVDKITYDWSNISQVPMIPGRMFEAVDHEDGRTITVPRECVYKTDGEVPWAIGKLIGDQLFQSRENQGNREGGCSLHYEMVSECQPWYLEPLFHGGRLTAETISADMERIALAISNRMRVVGTDAYRNHAGFAPGTVIQTTVCLRLDWPWLVLPAALVVLTGCLLVWVVMTAMSSQADGHPVWKSSALAVFFHGISTRPRTPDPAIEHTPGSPGKAENSPSSKSRSESGIALEIMSLKEMHAMAKKTVVTLEPAAPGRGGFLLVNEAQNKHHLASNKQNKPRRSADLHLDEETLPLTQLPNRDTAYERGRTFLQVDLGTGFAPSVRDSLDRSRQSSLEDSLERRAGSI